MDVVRPAVSSAFARLASAISPLKSPAPSVASKRPIPPPTRTAKKQRTPKEASEKKGKSKVSTRGHERSV